MKRRILLGNLYEQNEDSNKWFSRENIVPGTVRLIEGELYYSVPDILIGELDMCAQTRDTKITKWEVTKLANLCRKQ